MEMEGCQNVDLDPEAHGWTDGNQFSENQADLTTCGLAEALEAQKEVDLSMDDDDLLPELHKSREVEQTKTKGKYNLRKSLAWDSAFFTSAGVLDAEELSSMITGADKGKKDVLPVIQEDITGSTESISTLESDNLNLEILEEELFVDIRASIQRSNKKVPNSNSSDKKIDVEVDNTSISSLKNEGVSSSSQDKNPKPGSKRTSGLEPVTMSNSPAKQNVGKQGPRKAIKQGSGHSQMMSIPRIGERNPTLNKASKIINNSISTSTTTAKRDSMGVGRSKTDCGSSKLGAPATATSKGTQPPKVSVGVGRMLPRPAALSKSSLLNSSVTGRVQSTRSSTSSNSSNGLSSGAPPKSLTGRRNPCGSSNTVTGPSSSIPKTLSRTAVRNKPSPSKLSTHMTSKVSSSVSPASSISDWSSVSSPPSSMAIRKFNNSRTSIDTSSSRSTDGDTKFLHSKNSSADYTSGGHENREVNLSSNIPKKTSTGAIQTLTKPSGLRMPSPKIGFFDGVKSSPRTPNGHKPGQPGLRPALPKNGAAVSSPSRTSNGKLKGTKAPATRMSNSSASSKPESPKVTSLTFPQENSHESINSPSASLDVKLAATVSLGVEGNEPREEQLKAERVQVDDGVKQVVDAGKDDIVNGNLGDLNVNDFTVPEDIEPCIGNSRVAYLECASQNNNQNGLENNSHQTEKENACDKYQGAGIMGCKNVLSPKNELSRGEYDTIRPPFALKNEVCGNECIDGSTIVADNTSGSEPQV